MGNIARIDPKLSSNVGTCPGLPLQLVLTRIPFFQNDRPEPPLNKRAFIVVLAIIVARAINVIIARLSSL